MLHRREEVCRRRGDFIADEVGDLPVGTAGESGSPLQVPVPVLKPFSWVIHAVQHECRLCQQLP